MDCIGMLWEDGNVTGGWYNMLRLAIPFKKPVTVDNFCKFHEELEEITEKYFGHTEILVIFGVDDND